jgi:predicted RNase H-like HicB family nuclease
MTLQKHIHAIIYPGDQSGYIAECQEVSVVTQGSTLDEGSHNLREAVALYLEDEDAVKESLLFRRLGWSQDP